MASATGTNRWVGKWVAAGAMVVACGGCRGCAEDREAAPDAYVAQPTMPTGMLLPVEGAQAEAGAGAGVGAGALRVARRIKAGAWVELQIARPGDSADRREFTHWNEDSWFVTLEAMTLLHEPFARALSGFDLFLPRLFPPDALVKLAAELAAFGRTASGESGRIASDLAQVVTSVAAKKQSLWVLGPP